MDDIQNPKERYLLLSWRRNGLAEGTRMVHIQDTDITEEEPLADAISERWHRQDIKCLLEELSNDNEIETTFLENILDVDDSSPLGLPDDSEVDN